MRFWAALTGWARAGTGHAEFRRLVRPAGVPLRLLLQRLDDEQPTVTAHLDLACDDRTPRRRGTRRWAPRRLRRYDEWTVLRDPAGRRYCNTGRAPGAV